MVFLEAATWQMSLGDSLDLGVLRVVVSPVLVLAVLLTSVLILLIPILTIQLVYRGHVRERFIEVRDLVKI
ncbi:MAG: hypothetical protein QN229_06745 [Desulfurococcaceae archaeon TW002]